MINIITLTVIVSIVIDLSIGLFIHCELLVKNLTGNIFEPVYFVFFQDVCHECLVIFVIYFDDAFITFMKSYPRT